MLSDDDHHSSVASMINNVMMNDSVQIMTDTVQRINDSVKEYERMTENAKLYERMNDVVQQNDAVPSVQCMNANDTVEHINANDSVQNMNDMVQRMAENTKQYEEDSRVVKAILISHNGPQSFPEVKSDQNGFQNLGSPYVKITEKDGKFDSWVVLPLNEFQDIYHNEIGLVRKHLFGCITSRSENKSGVFPCEDCGYVYNRDYNLRRHRREKHAVVVKRVKCPYCGKFFIREDNLVRHVRIVHNDDEQCICIHCGADFNRHSSLKRHIMAKHKERKRFGCDLCDARFAYSWEVKVHTRNNHSSQPGYNCDKCNKVFKRPQNLSEHQKFAHDGYRVICRIKNCNELFLTMSNFKKHKRETHVFGDEMSKRGPRSGTSTPASYEIVSSSSLGETRIYCQLCGIICHGSGEMKKHYRTEHAKESKPRKESRIASIVYKCVKCGTTFKSEPHYQRHVTKYHPNSPTFSVTDESRVTCCDGLCDNDVSVTSELLALQENVDVVGFNVTV